MTAHQDPNLPLQYARPDPIIDIGSDIRRKINQIHIEMRKLLEHEVFNRSIEYRQLCAAMDIVDAKLNADWSARQPKFKVGFTKPTMFEVQARAKEIGLSQGQAEAFYFYFESKGWMVGRAKMVCWKGALSGWKVRSEQRGVFANNKPLTIVQQEIAAQKKGLDKI